MSRAPSPGAEGYWAELARESGRRRPEPGALARITEHPARPAVFVVERREPADEVLALLVAELDESQITMIFDADRRQRVSLARAALSGYSRPPLTIPDEHLAPLTGGSSA